MSIASSRRVIPTAFASCFSTPRICPTASSISAPARPARSCRSCGTIACASPSSRAGVQLSDRFRDLMTEERKDRWFGVFDTREDARAWLLGN